MANIIGTRPYIRDINELCKIYFMTVPHSKDGIKHAIKKYNDDIAVLQSIISGNAKNEVHDEGVLRDLKTMQLFVEFASLLIAYRETDNGKMEYTKFADVTERFEAVVWPDNALTSEYRAHEEHMLNSLNALKARVGL